MLEIVGHHFWIVHVFFVTFNVGRAALEALRPFLANSCGPEELFLPCFEISSSLLRDFFGWFTPPAPRGKLLRDTKVR